MGLPPPNTPDTDRYCVIADMILNRFLLHYFFLPLDFAFFAFADFLPEDFFFNFPLFFFIVSRILQPLFHAAFKSIFLKIPPLFSRKHLTNRSKNAALRAS